MRKLWGNRGDSLLHGRSAMPCQASESLEAIHSKLSTRRFVAWLPPLSFAAAVLLIFCGRQPAAGEPSLSEQTRDQIRMLQEEKRSRSLVERKLDSQIVYALHEKRQGRASEKVASLKPALLLDPEGRILVDIQTEVTGGLLKFIQSQGGVVINSFPRYHAVRALLPLPTVDVVAAHPAVRSMRPADRAAVNDVASAGDIAHRADVARNSFLVDGTGIKVGVLSDSVDYLSNVQGIGELPNVTVLPGQNGSGSGEGTAILQIVHTLAPGADLYFATAFSGVAGFAQNIHDLQAAGCRIIVDDVIYFNESPFQDGPIAQAVNDVCAAGTLFFSAAGNSGALDRSSSGTWEGDFKDGGQTLIGRGGHVHDFGGVTYNTVLPGGGSYLRVDLFWSDPLGASTNDYDVYIVDGTGSVVRSSTNVQDGNTDPYESIPVLNVGDRIVIVQYAGDSRYLFLSTGRGILSVPTAGSVRGHNASAAANAFSVAATRVSSPPQPFVGGTNNPIEWFSSDGPRRMFFYPDGTPITPGNFSSTGGTDIQKPDITAADGGNTSVPGFAPFLGTSAAAPHAAAIAALLWSYSPFLQPGGVRSLLTGTALDVDAPGFDRNSGFGIVMGYPSVAATAPLTLKSVQLLDANGNGQLDPDECADLVVSLQNSAPASGNSITGITAVLSSSATNLLVDQAARFYTDLAPGAIATSSVPFRVSTIPHFNYGSNLTFTVHLTTTNAGGFDVPFQIPSIVPLGPPSDFSYANQLPIPDVGEADSSVIVSDFNYAIGLAQVSVYISHPYDSDLRFSLVAPDGTTVLLSNQNGNSGTNYGAGCDNMTVFSDSASNSIDSGSAPFLGAYRPEQPLSVLNGKSGLAVNGVWTLRIEDLVAGDVGALQCWSLRLIPFTPSDGGGQCLVGPTVLQSPTEQRARAGDAVTFTVSAKGTAPLSYQWYYNQTNALPMATNSTLSLANIAPAQAGSYSAIVANPYGNVSSAAAELEVVIPPSIVCGTNRIVALGAAWDFDAPAAIGTNPVVTIVSTTTNAGCANSYAATRTWIVTDDTGYSNTCSQTVLVSDTTAIVPSCPADKATLLGADWAFDSPIFVESGDPEVLVYDNWTNNLQTNLVAGSLEIGNQITLGGTAQYPTLLSFGYWGTNSTQANFEGVVEVEVRFYQNDGALLASGATAPGTLIYDSGPVPVSATNQGTVSLQNFQAGAALPLAGPLPSNFTWTVQFSGLNSNDSAGLNLYWPPVVGQALAEYWQNTGSGWILETNAAGTADFGGQLEAVSLGVNVVVLSTHTNATCGNGFAATRTWQAIDGCSNVATCSQTVSVVDQGPPGILMQPQSAALPVGGTANLAVTVSSCPPLAYQWYFNTTNRLDQQTNATLVLNNLTLDLAGAYTVIVTNGFGSITSSPAVLNIGFAPLITADLTNQTAAEGDNLSFGVVAQGSQPLSYQWYFKASAIGAQTNATLVLNGVTAAEAGNYQVIVANVYGSATSAVAQLTVVVPTIVCGPNHTVELGMAWDFDPPVVTGTNAVLTVLGTTTNAGCGGTFAATRTWVVSDATGYSNTCSQTVSVVDTTPPLLTCPTNKTVIYGTAWDFDSPAASDVGAVESVVYNNWISNFSGLFPLSTNEVGNEITLAEPGLYLSSLAFDYWGTNAQQTDFEGAVQVQVRFYQNDGPATFSSAPGSPGTLFYDSGPLPVSASPTGTVVLTDFQLSAAVPLIGRLPSSFTWSVQFSGLSSNDTAGLSLYSPPVVGQALPEYWERRQTGWVLQTNAAGPATFGAELDAVNSGVNFVVLATATNPICGNGFTATRTWGILDGCGNSTNCSQTVSVLDQGPPTMLTQPQDQVAVVGATATFVGGVSSCPLLGYQWYFNGTNSLEQQTNATLILNNLTLSQAGSYTLKAVNNYGSTTSSPALLSVGFAPVITSDPLNQQAAAGDTVLISASAQGTDPLAYQWLFNATNPLPGQTLSTLLLTNLSSDQAGSYSLVVTNLFGSATSALAQLTVIGPPFIVSGPISQQVTNGSTVTFSVVAQATPPPTYQWYFNLTNLIFNGTNASLTLTGVSPDQAGTYSVVIANDYGAVTNPPVQLSVIVPPTIVCGADRTVPVGTSWDFDPPVFTGKNAQLTVLNTITNPGCGASFSATRTWVVSDASGYSATCAQTVAVTETNPPPLTCPADKSVALGSAWSFDEPSVSTLGMVNELVYDNLTNNLLEPLISDSLEIGNQIVLAGSSRYLTELAIPYWGTNSQQTNFEGDVQVRVRFYYDNGPALDSTFSSPGTVFYDSGLLPVSATSNGSVVLTDFQLSALVPLVMPLPSSFTWSIQFSGLSSNDSAGLNLYAPPVVGQVLPQYWQNTSSGWTLQTNLVGSADFGGQLLAINSGVTLTVLGTETNATCGNGFNATRTWQAIDGCSNVATCSQTVSVIDQGPPGILMQPQSAALPVGGTANLAVSVSSCPPLAYQWYFNTTNSLDQQTNATLVLSNLTLDLAGAYTVIVTNGFGSITSTPAVLNIGFAPLITADLTNQTAAEGDTVSFGVVAQGSQPLSYQWYFNASAIEAQTNATLVLNGVTAAETGNYQVTVANVYGSATSAVAQLTVVVPTIVCGPNHTVELGMAWDFDPPVVTGTNAVLTVLGTTTNAGCGGTFAATRTWVVSDATGYSNTCSQTVSVVDTTPPLLTCPTNKTVIYGSAWMFDSPSATDLDGVAIAVLSTQTNATCGNGFVAIRTWQAMDACSNASTCSQTVTVIDQGPPTILTQPQSANLVVGTTGQISVSVSSCGPADYQWYFNSTNSLDQQTNATLVLSNLTLSDAGSYMVVVTNGYGSVTSSPAILAVGFAATITSDLTNQTALQGDTVDFEVTASGTLPINYQWYFNATNLIPGAIGPSLQLFNVAPQQSGDYSVVVANAFGTVTSTLALLSVEGPPFIIYNPSDQLTTNGGSATFSVTAQVTPGLSYQWYFNDTNSLAGATNAALVLTNVTPAQVGSYFVVVSNNFGSLPSTRAQLDLLLPIIPASLSVTNTATASFEASVQGAGSLGYQWYFNLTNPIPGATGTTLTLSNVTPSNLGTYSISVSNNAGSVVSQEASLRVLIAPQILSITSTNGLVTLTFSTVPNLYYEIYYKTNILDPNWLGLPKKADVLLKILGTGSPMSAQDVIGDQQRFYTVIAQ